MNFRAQYRESALKILRYLSGSEHPDDEDFSKETIDQITNYIAEAKTGKPGHGTVSRYTKYGCRCAKCRKAATDYHKSWREKNAKKSV
jgi:hypothetical protein